MLHILGMRVYGYQRRSADRMRHGLREGLPWLPWAQDGIFYFTKPVVVFPGFKCKYFFTAETAEDR
jgi:hypothetical protein